MHTYRPQSTAIRCSDLLCVLGQVLAKCGSYHDFDEVLGIRQPRLDRGTGRRLAGLDPFHPDLIHCRNLVHILEEYLAREDAILVSPRLGQQAIDMTENLSGLTANVCRRIRAGDLAGQVNHTVMHDILGVSVPNVGALQCFAWHMKVLYLT